MPSGTVDLAGKVIDGAGADKVGLTVELWQSSAWETPGARTAADTTDSDGLWSFTGQDITKTWLVCVIDGAKKYLIDARNAFQVTNVDIIDDISVDTIYEHTIGSGVTIDGLLVKDNGFGGVAGAGIAAGRFQDNALLIDNPAGTFTYTVVGGAIAADRQLNIPVLTATDTLVVLGLAQTLVSKTLTAPDINGGSADSLTSLSIRSTGAAYDLTFASAEVLTGGKTLSFNVGDTARTITLSGNPTLADWFDQSVKQAANPTFGNLTIASFAANWTNAGRTVADLGTVTTAILNGGTIDGAAIGGATPAAGAFTTLGASGVASVTDATDATTTTSASLKTAGGIAAVMAVHVGTNLVVASANAKAQQTHKAENVQGVAQAATTIATTGGFGSLVLVTGELTPTTNARFLDIVLAGYNTTPTVVASHTVMGSPPARTYTQAFAALQLAMASGTYDVTAYHISSARPL